MAIDALYRDQRPALLRFLYRRTTPDRAQDAVQQVFAKLVGRTFFNPDDLAAPAAYLRSAVNNAVRDDERSCGRADQLAEFDLEGPAALTVEPIAQLEARDRLRRIEAAVQRLKPLTRQVFLARRLDGYSYAEIAAQTGLSERGVEKQMRIAIRLLGRHLRAHD